LPDLAADPVRRRARVIVAFGSGPAVRAAKAAIDTTPIVFGFGADPVQQGLVASLKSADIHEGSAPSQCSPRNAGYFQAEELLASQ